ncbi:MAG: hypothetical protein IH940_06020 [Acidobacteria bacterium]|nr:hypothetical protein [Acidobacteriota bacterium]
MTDSEVGSSQDESDDVAETDPDQASDSSEGRVSRIPALLIAFATVIAFLGAVTTWVRVQALDTDSWVSVSSELLEEQEVREAVSTFVVDELYASVDVTAEIEEQLPEDFKGLAGPVSSGLRGVLTETVDRLLGSPAFATLWEEANRTAHQTLVNILRDETPENISTAEGSVVVNLSGIVKEVGSTIGIPDAALDQIPEEAGQFVVLESDELDKAQEVVQVLDFLSWFILLIVILLYAAAVYLASGRRVKVLRNVGFSLVGVGVVLLLSRSLAAGFLVNSLVESSGDRALAETVTFVFTGLLRQMAWTGIIDGVLIVLFASLLGEHRWAVAARRLVSPMTNGSPVAVAGGTAFLILILMWWSPGRALDRWISALLLVGLIIGAVVAVRRRTLTEFPDMTFSEAIGRS